VCRIAFVLFVRIGLTKDTFVLRPTNDGLEPRQFRLGLERHRKIHLAFIGHRTVRHGQFGFQTATRSAEAGQLGAGGGASRNSLIRGLTLPPRHASEVAASPFFRNASRSAQKNTRCPERLASALPSGIPQHQPREVSTQNTQRKQ
jgi:hypothetical protein